jgi:hypothetical protein
MVAAMLQVRQRRFSRKVLTEIDVNRMLGIRSGREHRFTWVWVVVIKQRVFIRSWNDKPTGWFRAFVDEPLGAMKIADREVAIRARKARGEGLMKSIESGYAEKYTTPASIRYVRGFKAPRRRKSTMEITPR